MKMGCSPDIDNQTIQKQERLYSDVVIIGAGLSGINMACQLQRQLSVYDITVQSLLLFHYRNMFKMKI
jgi:NADH dehydrogenase FAD-containing subunit